jgi:hypothetical protein
MQILWAAILTLWVIWFVDRRREIEKLATLINPNLIPTSDTSVVVLIVVGVVLLSMLGAGSIVRAYVNPTEPGIVPPMA